MSTLQISGEHVPPEILPVVPPSTIARIREREEAAVQREMAKASMIASGVSREAQLLFNGLAKTMRCRWDGQTICVEYDRSDSGVRIGSPYTSEKVSGASEELVARVRKVLEGERSKISWWLVAVKRRGGRGRGRAGDADRLGGRQGPGRQRRKGGRGMATGTGYHAWSEGRITAPARLARALPCDARVTAHGRCAPRLAVDTASGALLAQHSRARRGGWEQLWVVVEAEDAAADGVRLGCRVAHVPTVFSTLAQARGMARPHWSLFWLAALGDGHESNLASSDGRHPKRHPRVWMLAAWAMLLAREEMRAEHL
eukprot:CAMPEP_0172181116 /NCGR_PEP_ID=MMETSP1050-20130122/17635_1 /TAXON_ID=233186 /ORGANISM="Cryptomonas curvata, Strain CCAP979/52" /LENGTH=313 /DNA_ID=CAMNT_0012854355 /DNA_START=299 /DNA_END=1239 /DNA_ORIENTATION=+